MNTYLRFCYKPHTANALSSRIAWSFILGKIIQRLFVIRYLGGAVCAGNRPELHGISTAGDSYLTALDYNQRRPNCRALARAVARAIRVFGEGIYRHAFIIGQVLAK